ncbi:hypothetical protein FHX63_004017 [Cupriavidus plantarum]|nr:hypothetical protein [Cupriavidus plantarum]REE94046.1 hypothetical protein C7418_2819 [Cupriavidus plantarum]CAG2133585.1 hypothetical protein LMG26296_01837 [Cupriavidus plantarum]SMR84223.1 hypothetical protein SAMN05421735_3008 [Cupriavidus plantarum]
MTRMTRPALPPVAVPVAMQYRDNPTSVGGGRIDKKHPA